MFTETAARERAGASEGSGGGGAAAAAAALPGRRAAECPGSAGALPVRGAGQGGIGAAAGVRHLPGRAPAGPAVQRGAGVPAHLPRGVYPRVGEEEEQLPAVQGQGRAAASGVRGSVRR